MKEHLHKEGGHWKSRSKKQKSSIKEDDLSQPWGRSGSFQPCAEKDTTSLEATRNREKTTFLKKRRDFKNQQRSERRRDTFTLLTKSPREILALDKGKFKTHPQMTTPVEKRNSSKLCEFHTEVGHNTDECMHLKRQIEELIKAEKLSHVIKKTRNQENPSNPINSSQNVKIPSMMVSKPEAQPSNVIRSAKEKIKVAIHAKHLEQMIAIRSTLTEEGRKALEGCLPVRQKKRSQAPERNKAIQEEVGKLVDAGIMKEVHYHSWLSNPEVHRTRSICVTYFTNEGKYDVLLREVQHTSQGILRRSFLKTSRGIVDLGKGFMTIYPDPDPFHDNSDSLDDPIDEWDDLLENIDFGDIREIDELPPFVCNMGKKTAQDKLKRDIYERVLMIQESRLIIEMLKNSDQHKKLLDSILLDKLKLDEEIKEREEEAAKEVIRNYKTLREKNDLGAFVIPICVDGKCDTHALADTGSNINVLPNGIYMQIEAGEIEVIEDKIRMLDHSRAEPMGILRDVLCHVGVTTILARFLVLDIPVDKDAPIVAGRSFLYSCGGIINTITGTTSTFNGIFHQQFPVAAIKKYLKIII
nr:reverse transcriptase domain-containing protein [Tanacetum cinerariifolium]